MRPPGAVITPLKCVRRLLMDAGIAVTARISAKLTNLSNFRGSWRRATILNLIVSSALVFVNDLLLRP